MIAHVELQTDLFEVRWLHVAKGLSRHAMVSQDGQVVLSWQFAQQVDQTFVHTRFLQNDYSLKNSSLISRCFCVSSLLFTVPACAATGAWHPTVSGTGSSSSSAGWTQTSAPSQPGKRKSKCLSQLTGHRETQQGKQTELFVEGILWNFWHFYFQPTQPCSYW